MVDKMLADMEQAVAQARRVYLRAADRGRRNPQAAYNMWRLYASLLQSYRKELRKHDRSE